MKVTLKHNQKAYSGELDGMIYYYHPKLKTVIGRRKPERTSPNSSSERHGKISKNLAMIQPSEGYKQDLALYITLLDDHDLGAGLLNWYTLFLKIMYAMQRKYPESVDLVTITKAEIIADDLPCISLKRAVEEGLIPLVPGFERFDKQL